jgi:hypothetical protein
MPFEDFYIPIDKHNKYCSLNYWVGCGVGAIGMFILCLVLGYYLP